MFGSMMPEWELKLKKAAGNVEIEMSSQFDELVAGVISGVVFQGDHRAASGIHLAQELQLLVLSSIFKFLSHIPGFRYLPTKGNLKMRKLQKQLRDILANTVKNRVAAKDTAGYGNDMFGVLLEGCIAEKGQNLLKSMDEIIEECKTFYLARHETTLQLLTWTTFLSSTYPKWREKLREEVLRECGKEIPVSGTLNKLKLVSMFILETLRFIAPSRKSRGKRAWISSSAASRCPKVRTG
ncbi:hypothetical protein QYE76_039577 [Lolium multiflorum]|uniref:Cytochrome P450 n=1 Tax=Lolium multiflorum TaxID=4521 RepID=A0AAD8T9Y3_LOLMU|nr:hypothetical protein QYE76_039577 [Lolium multiflorum]